MKKAVTKQARTDIHKENLRWPVELKLLPKAMWPDPAPPTLLAMWRSRNYFVQIHSVQNKIEQMIVMRTVPDAGGKGMAGGIDHSTLQRLKKEAGYELVFAVEIFPPDSQLVDTAGARYLWLMPKPIPFALRPADMQNTGMGLIHDPNLDMPMAALLQPPDRNRIIITDED